MSPYSNTNYGQTVITLCDNETCPISDDDLFKDYKKKNVVIDVLNSKFYLPIHDIDLIQGCIYNSHQYFDQGFLEKINDYLEDDAVILDIGANIGNHTLYWANERKAKKIYAFEPIPFTFKILKKNIKINNLEDKVLLYNIGLADKKCKGEIKIFCKQNIGGTRLRVLNSDSKITFPLKSLDSLNIEEDRIDLLKIDVEGMDNEVLIGAVNTIKKYKPIIMIESFDYSLEKSNSILEELGYKQELRLGCCEYLYIPKDKLLHKKKKKLNEVCPKDEALVSTEIPAEHKTEENTQSGMVIKVSYNNITDTYIDGKLISTKFNDSESAHN